MDTGSSVFNWRHLHSATSTNYFMFDVQGTGTKPTTFILSSCLFIGNLDLSLKVVRQEVLEKIIHGHRCNSSKGTFLKMPHQILPKRLPAVQPLENMGIF